MRMKPAKRVNKHPGNYRANDFGGFLTNIASRRASGCARTGPESTVFLNPGLILRIRRRVADFSQRRAWIRTITDFLDLDPDCVNHFKNFGSEPDLDGANGKKSAAFLFLKTVFCQYFGLHFDLDFTLKRFLDYGWTWTEFQNFRTGSQNMTVRSSLTFLL